MQTNVKFKLIRSGFSGQVLGQVPILEDSYFFDMFRAMFNSSDMTSVRVVVGQKVIEMHTDKHKNLIYREYEKKK